MATRDFLKQIREQVIANKADSGWLPMPHNPGVLLYSAWLGDTPQDILSAIITRQENKDFIYYTLTLVNPTRQENKNPKSTVELMFTTEEDAKLVHKLMIDEEKRYVAWEKANPPPLPIDLGVVTIKSAADLENLINKLKMLINPAAKGDSSKVKN